MKKLKLFLLMFVAAVGMCNLTSCKDDDDKSGAASIVGTWEWEEAGNGYDRFIFNADGSYRNIGEDYEMGTWTEFGTYTYDGRSLTLKTSDGNVDTFDVIVSGNEMIWYVEGERFVYVRQ